MALDPDPVLPQRDRLLDLDAMVSVISRSLGRRGTAPIRSCRLGSITYRPGKRLRVVYRVEAGGRDMHVAAGTFRTRSRAERAFLRAIQRAGDAGRDADPLRPAGYDAGLETVFWTFPNDRRLESLSAVVEAREDLTGLVDPNWSRSRLVDYNPETSAVVGCLEDSGRVVGYAKVHAGDEGEHTYRVHQAFARLARGSGLRIPRPLAYSGRHRTLLVEPITGTSIRWLTGADLLAGLHAYGVALARLHSLPSGGLETGGRDALERLRHRADGVRTIRPDVAGLLGELLGELTARWGEAPEPPVPIHGDTNESNAILAGGQVALIDFDRARVGAAGSDVGNFLSLLRYFRSLGLISPRAERARAAGFTRGYASVRALPPREALRVHEAAALAERAFRAVARLRGAALLQIPALLAEARGLLQ
jgi:hypothetical protein